MCSKRSNSSEAICISSMSGFGVKFVAPCSSGSLLIRLSSIGYLIELFSTRSGYKLLKIASYYFIFRFSSSRSSSAGVKTGSGRERFLFLSTLSVVCLESDCPWRNSIRTILTYHLQVALHRLFLCSRLVVNPIKIVIVRSAVLQSTGLSLLPGFNFLLLLGFSSLLHLLLTLQSSVFFLLLFHDFSHFALLRL